MKSRTVLRASAKDAATQTREQRDFRPDNCDVQVQLNDEADLQHLKQWLAVLPDGFMYEFDHEADACTFQRDYRKELGLDPMTGERMAVDETVAGQAMDVLGGLPATNQAAVDDGGLTGAKERELVAGFADEVGNLEGKSAAQVCESFERFCAAHRERIEELSRLWAPISTVGHDGLMLELNGYLDADLDQATFAIECRKVFAWIEERLCDCNAETESAMALFLYGADGAVNYFEQHRKIDDDALPRHSG